MRHQRLEELGEELSGQCQSLRGNDRVFGEPQEASALRDCVLQFQV